MGGKKDLIVVCGPTASGKTALGVQIALKSGGEIISADSRQVYRGMDIGTGKDLKEYITESGSVPYHLIDIADPSQIYTLFQYRKDFFKAYSQIIASNHLPVMVGGTGLYIEAVIKDYAIPEIPENPELRCRLMVEEKSVLEQKLFSLNRLLYEKTDRSSKKRIIRAIEIALSGQKDEPKMQFSHSLDPLVLCTRWDRAKLRDRIDRRLQERLKQGMVEEVRRLLQSGIPKERFSLFGMEYKHVASFIGGEVAYEVMIDQLRHSIHQLAKRQETWFRGMERRGIAVNWIDEADLESAMRIVLSQSFKKN